MSAKDVPMRLLDNNNKEYMLNKVDPMEPTEELKMLFKNKTFVPHLLERQMEEDIENGVSQEDLDLEFAEYIKSRKLPPVHKRRWLNFKYWILGIFYIILLKIRGKL